MYHISTMCMSNFLSTCIPNTVANYLLFQYQWSTFFEKYYNTMAGLMYVSSEVSWWAGERDRLPGCALWKLTKLEPNIQCTRLPMWSTGNYGLVVWRCTLPIEIWNNRQTGYTVQLYVSKAGPEWQWTSDVINWTAVCGVLCTVENFL